MRKICAKHHFPGESTAYYVKNSSAVRNALWLAADNVKEILFNIENLHNAHPLLIMKVHLQSLIYFLAHQNAEGFGGVWDAKYWTRTYSFFIRQTCIAKEILESALINLGGNLPINSSIRGTVNNLNSLINENSGGSGNADYWEKICIDLSKQMKNVSQNLVEIFNSI
ncbi:MAG: hypothetical protein HQM10_09380 [Candidatus Riflebacteria bacterium]|nr:hypothetical protein [Candidatus Riflebacteria bacterium]